ncbi:hypothetical protein E1301_Tti022670 [Triplophysa tibetana]|uniref:C2H2-type domain-containing protein n=1 Tax=Triplophysa tibetana TaxID=1572043 RepID=A0A5A9MZR3_9TELE|nr:hypothetical protein E1301_Tti022670 [Triplophysa tibetana]
MLLVIDSFKGNEKKYVLRMTSQVDVMCCKSVGTDLSMLDIDDFITEICQLKKEVELLEEKLRTRGDELNTEDVSAVLWSQSSVRVNDGSFKESLDSVWSSGDQITPQPLLDKLSEQRSSLTLLCYTDTNPTDAQDTASNHTLNQDESTDQTTTESLGSVCNAGEQQTLNTIPLKMCSVKLMDCRKLMEMKTEPTPEKDQTDEEENHEDFVPSVSLEIKTEPKSEEEPTEEHENDDFIPSDERSDSCCDGEMASTSKQRLTAQTLSRITCGKTFSSQRHLKTRERKHTEQKLFTCTRCNISFPSSQEKNLHSQEHRDKKHFHCEQCRKNFLSSSRLKVHVRTHSGEKSFHCSECDKYFSIKANLVLHQRIHTGEKRSEKRFVGLQTHQKKHNEEQTDLKSHKTTHTKEKLLQCSHCEKRFRYKSHQITHERVHTGVKPYHCPHCGKSFTDPSTLRVHLRIHTGEKPYKCSLCGKSFNQRNNLVTHQRIHTGERPFECSHCEMSFAQMSVLKNHERIHTGEKPYQCSSCGERFTYSKSLQTHQKKHAEEQTALETS